MNPAYKDPRLRHAISMAIDRQKIIDDQFEGAREPADSWGAPGIEGFNAGTCGEFCTFDPEKAKALLARGRWLQGRQDLDQPPTADSDHKGWITATCNSIRSTRWGSTASPASFRTSPPSARRSVTGRWSRCSGPGGSRTTRTSRTS